MTQLATSDGVGVGLEEGQHWLRDFERTHGRPLRVLHIGNIANNAFYNSSIQRLRGIDAYALSFDYYHIMACPEWEDSNFSGDVGDPFFPDWWSVDLKGYKRPRWFASGPLDACIRYLLAETAGKRGARWLWRALNFERWLLSHRGRLRDLTLRGIAWLTGYTPSYPGNPANAILLRLVGGKTHGVGVRIFGKTALGDWLRFRGRRLLRAARTAHLAEDAGRHLRLTHRAAARARARGERMLREIGRDDAAVDLDWFFVWWWHPYFKLLLKRFDIVQCYATYTAMPFVIGHKNYVAYEHGTIRSIPFAANTEGRMCMASYRAAPSVMVTNLDNLEAAEKMGLDPSRVTCLPHAFDSDKLSRFAMTASRPAAGQPVTFVTPSRQHWVDGDPGMAKGNDRVFAALKLLKQRGYRCALRAIAWGNDLDASRRLVAELGIEDMVEWLPTMKKQEVWLECTRAHAVIDQFVIPAFGGITFEAMMLGCRVITRVDEKRAAEFFGETPPLCNCETAEQIADWMARIADDPADAAGIGRRTQEWMQRYHSADRIVALQVKAYRRLVETYGAASPQKAAASVAGPPTTAIAPATAVAKDQARVRTWMRALQPYYAARPWVRKTESDEIVMLVISALRIDPRVEREARALAARGWRVRVVAPDISDPLHAAVPIDWGPNVIFDMLPGVTSEYILKAPWLAGEEIYRRAVATAPFAYHCHDLNTALVGLRAASRTGARWVCDFHEWSSENVTWNDDRRRWEPHAPLQRLLFRAVEKCALRLADEVITVNQSIAEQLEALGGNPTRRVRVVRNIPSLDAVPTRVYPPLKRQLNLPDDAFVVLYQGGTGATRYLEPVIEALKFAPEVTLVIRGPSLDLWGPGYRAVAGAAGVGARLVLADPVPSRDVVAAARGADAGLWTLPNLSPNFYYALPNKVFEYVAAGLPLLAAHYPEPARLVRDHGIGLVFDPDDPRSIARQMRRLAVEPNLAGDIRAAIPDFLGKIDAAGEWNRLADIYQNLRDGEHPAVEAA